MNNLSITGRKEPHFPKSYAGISTIKCNGCRFEFVFIEPEETMSALLTINNHILITHGGKNLSEVQATLSRH
jgi:hypothetical protein